MIIISIDAMGADRGPEIVIPALNSLALRCPDLRFRVYGREEILKPLLKNNPAAAAVSTVFHCETIVRMEDKPASAVRAGQGKSSMWQAIESVKNKQADACVSSGNTGALMAMAKICLSLIAHVERPSIAAIWPHRTGSSIVLDVGATVRVNARQLIDFAVLGSAMARALWDIPRPCVGLLNVGVEENKGQPEIKEASRILRSLSLDSLDYKGFVEGNDLGKGKVDVVVTEGFAGNIALKTAEGTARQMADNLKEAMESTFMTRLGYCLARKGLKKIREKMNVNQMNGGVFLGLKGIVVKSHGSSNSEGFCAAVDLAVKMVNNRLLSRIEKDLETLDANYVNAIKEKTTILTTGSVL